VSELFGRAPHGPGDGLEIGGAASNCKAGDVTQERRVRPCAAFVRGDSGQIENGSRVVGVELELCAAEPRRRGDGIAGLVQPGIHGGILAERRPACA
jgi:hypothetical protein